MFSVLLASQLALTHGQDLFLSARSPHAEVSVPHLDKFHPERRGTIQRVLGQSYASGHRVTVSTDRVFRPQDFGADPSGKADSHAAISKAIQALLSVAEVTNGTYADLGGATLDLAGGHFSVSKAVVMPKGYMNFKIGGGTIGALRESFPAGGALLTIGDASAKRGKACMNIDLSHLVLDGAGVAGTALAVLNVQYANIGPAFMAYGFSDYGVKSDGSGGGFVHKAWLGQAAPDGRQWLADREASGGNLPTATAISMENNQHDWYIEDVIIWSAAVGVRSMNGANQLQGVHTWGLATAKGGIGIYLASGKGKVIDSYLDFSPLVIVDPNNVVVSNNLFLATANLVIEAGSKKCARNMIISGNRWDSEMKFKNDTIIVNGDIATLEDSVIESNAADTNWNVKSTRATRTVSVSNATEVTLDFSKDLLFDMSITEAMCQVQAWQFVDHVVQPPTDRSVKVLLSKSLPNVKVTCTVEQSTRTHAGH